MKRRDFVRRTAVGGAAGAMLVGCDKEAAAPNVQTRKKITWDLASSFPPALDTIHGAATVMSERVKELTGGNFVIKVNDPGIIAPGTEVLSAVREGAASMGHTAGYYYIGLNPTLAFDTSVPFGLNARQQASWMLSAGGMELMREVYGEYGIVNFPGGNTGTQMGGWFQKEITQLSDLTNLRMRIPGLGGKVMSALGVNVQNLAGGEVLDALQKKVIDAAEWVGPYDDLKLGFNRVAKFYYYPGWWEPGPALTFLVNQRQYEKLPADYQAALGAACSEAAFRMMADYDAKNPAALKTLLESGVELRSYPEDVMQAASEKIAENLAEEAGSSPQFKKVYEHWDAYKNASSEWFNLAERAFSNFNA